MALHNARDWGDAQAKFPIGSMVEGKVIRAEPFGVFLEIRGCRVHAVLLVTEFVDDDRSFDIADYPPLGTRIDAVVVDHAAHSRQLRLSTRSSRLP